MREMRDSGVEWIGEIPKDWNCCKQKYRFTLINGRAFKDNEFEEDGTYRILRVGNLFSNPVWYSSSLELEPDKYCEKGDLIYAWSMSYGPYIWNEEKVIYHYHIWKTKLVSDMDKMFSYYYLQALTESIKSQTHETTMGFVTMGIMNNSYIAYPRNIKEQKKIYWNGIRTFGIFCDYGLSIPEYVSLAVKLKEQKSVSRLGNRNDDAEENDKDDSDAGDIGNIRFWNLPIYHDDWRDNLTIELTQEEAFYLDKQIQKSTKGSLLEYVLKNHIDLNEYDDFASLTAELSEKVSEKLAYMMKLACDFNNLVYMARVRYNVMLSEDENTYANDEWSRLLPDIRHNATVDLDAVFGELQLINPRAKSFLSGIQTAFMASDIDMADELIRKRERSLKGAARAKLSRTKEFDHSKWVGGGMLDYRFSNARRIVNDIYAGEVNADV